jgi:hypothetical protein
MFFDVSPVYTFSFHFKDSNCVYFVFDITIKSLNKLDCCIIIKFIFEMIKTISFKNSMNYIIF